jgi:hypothetical protein
MRFPPTSEQYRRVASQVLVLRMSPERCRFSEVCLLPFRLFCQMSASLAFLSTQVRLQVYIYRMPARALLRLMSLRYIQFFESTRAVALGVYRVVACLSSIPFLNSTDVFFTPAHYDLQFSRFQARLTCHSTPCMHRASQVALDCCSSSCEPGVMR